MAVSDTLEGKSVVHTTPPHLQEPSEPDRANGFDFLRFVLAMLVILSHSLLIAGDRSREPLARLTHNQMTLGSCAVNGFFIISGFLVSQSWERSRSVRDYLRKRALRILPGFIVASLLSTFVVGALGTKSLTGYYTWKMAAKSLLYLIILTAPYSPPSAFVGMPLPAVNGPLWTIQFEALCYLLIVALGLTGMLRSRFPVLLLFVLAWTIEMLQLRHIITLSAPEPHLRLILLGGPYCSTFFLSGVCFYLYRDRITYSRRGAILAGVVLAASVVTQRLTFLLLPTAGSYLLLYSAIKALKPLRNFARHGDLSYGIYLYGWPVQALILWYTHASIDPWVLFFVAFPLSLLPAILSWHLIERPFLRRKGRTGH